MDNPGTEIINYLEIDSTFWWWKNGALVSVDNLEQSCPS